MRCVNLQGTLWEIIKKIRMIGSGNNHQLFVITD